MQTVGSSGSHFGGFGGALWQAARSLTTGVTGEPALFLPFFFFLPLMSRPCRPSIEQLPIAVLPALESGRLTVFPGLTFAGFVRGALPEDWMPSTTTRLPLPPLTRTEIAPVLRIACCWELSTLTVPPPLPFFFLPSAIPTISAQPSRAAQATTNMEFPLLNATSPLLRRSRRIKNSRTHPPLGACETYQRLVPRPATGRGTKPDYVPTSSSCTSTSSRPMRSASWTSCTSSSWAPRQPAAAWSSPAASPPRPASGRCRCRTPVHPDSRSASSRDHSPRLGQA